MTARKSVFILAFLIAFAWATAGNAQSGPPTVGGALPAFDLPKSKDAADNQYLGLSIFGNTFKVDQIKAKVVIIEIFSMYCPYCQREAPNINNLHQLIETNLAYKNNVKIIGIGVGNTQFEVGTFKKKYNIAFPLFPDEGFKLHKILGETRTPYFIVVKLNGNDPPKVIYSRQGALENIDSFLRQIADLSGLR